MIRKGAEKETNQTNNCSLYAPDKMGGCGSCRTAKPRKSGFQIAHSCPILYL